MSIVQQEIAFINLIKRHKERGIADHYWHMTVTQETDREREGTDRRKVYQPPSQIR